MRYLRDLKYRTGMDGLFHRQMMMMIFLSGMGADAKLLDKHLKNLESQYLKTIDGVDLYTGRENEPDKPEEERVEHSDNAKAAYIKLIDKKDAFQSLDEIIERIDQIKSDIETGIRR